MSNQVRIIDNISGSILFETSFEKISEAYAFAAMLENEGLDIKIDAPGLSETLIKSLGANETEISDYKLSMDNEIEDHINDLGCAVCLPKKSAE
jgi:hypothetical protein